MNTRRRRVSPDERAVADLVSRAMWRARLLALAEAAAWGAAAAAASTLATPSLPIALLALVIVAAAVAAWRWRQITRRRVVRSLERAHPDARNLFVTAEELTDETLTARAPVRARILADATSHARLVDVSSAFPSRRAVYAAGVAVFAWAIALAATTWRAPIGREAARLTGRAAAPGPGDAGAIRITATIRPPAYTNVKGATIADPQQLQAIEGSDVTLAIDARASSVIVDHDGDTRTLAPGAGGAFSDRIQVAKTGYVLVTADAGARRLVPIVVSPDALPSVRLTAPGRDLLYSGGNPSLTFTARATDDYGLRSLALRYTKVTGSGEQFEFQEGELPLTVTPANARDWTGSVTRPLADLNLKEGDMLVYRAVAADQRPGDGSASSDAFFIEISKLGILAGDAFTLPEEETRYALSQQMLIVKTERLNQQRRTMPPEAVTEAAMNLSVEQRMIRAEFVFMLGGEIEDEEVEAEQSTELQSGRLQNRGQADLRAATIAMSQAQKLLTGANTVDALTAERAAVVALQRAFTRDRYILRALATRSQLDFTRRLTGNAEGAADWHRVPPDRPANRRIARLEDLVSGLAELQHAVMFRQQALVLAEEAERIDPASAAMRDVATALQQAASGDPATRTKALSAAALAATTESRKAHADAAVSLPAAARGLSGAFADALDKDARLKPRAPSDGGDVRR
jgi:hypothetical protein